MSSPGQHSGEGLSSLAKADRKAHFWAKATTCLAIALLVFLEPAHHAIPLHAATTSFATNTLIIPMDVQYQDNGMWKSYGLVYDLLSKGIPVSWAINASKTFSGNDFTATSQDLMTSTGLGAHDYGGGPFIIDSAYAAQATPYIQAWWSKNANQPQVHKATAPFSASVDVVLKNPPRIATELSNAKIAIAYYNAAGIPDLNGSKWSLQSPNILDQAEIANGALFPGGLDTPRNYDVIVLHNPGYAYSLTDPSNTGTRTYSQLDYFVQQGGGWVSLDEAINTNENAVAQLYLNSSPSVRALFTSNTNGGLLTQTGFSRIDNKNGTWSVAKPGLPVAQAVDTPSAVQALPGGTAQDWDRTSVSYYARTDAVASFTNAGITYDHTINGVTHNGGGIGQVTYLGGHSFSTGLPYSGNYEAPYLRFFFNALFFNGSGSARLDITTSLTTIPHNWPSDVVINLSNGGAASALNTSTVSITLVPGVTYLGAVAGPAPTVTGNPSIGTTLSWGSSLGSVAGGATPVQVQVRWTPSSQGQQKIASMYASYSDPYGAAFTAAVARSVEVYSAPHPEMTKVPSSQGPFYPGQVVSWTLTAGNTGTAALATTAVEDTLPAGFTYKSATPSPSSSTLLPDGTTRVRWDVGTISAGATAPITLNAYAGGSPATKTNAVTLSGKDSNNFNYSVSTSAQVIISASVVTLNKTVSPSTPVNITTPGQVLTYSIQPSFSGGEIDNILVSDPVPAYSTYVPGSVNAGGSYGYASLAAINGVDDFGGGLTTSVSVSATPTVVALGGTVTVTMTLTNNSGATITAIVPSLQESRSYATVSAPTPSSVPSLANGASTNFSFLATLISAGESVFDGSATGTLGGADYSFADGYSNSVLAVTALNPSPVNDVVTWRLGSNAAAVPGELIISGFTPGVYATRGGNTKEFSKYGTGSNAWTAKAQPTNGIEKGGSLTVDPATHVIYASEGNSALFHKYDIATNTWTQLANANSNFNEGGGVQYLEVGGVKYVYAALGNSNRFRRYSIATNTWTNLSNAPSSLKRGGSITTDGTNLYLTEGNRRTTFWRYNVASDTWTTLASTPAAVGWGGSLTRVGDFIYLLQGDGKTGFYRYSISANTWLSMANTPGGVNAGGALATEGASYIYALQGNSLAFWRYTISTNSWTAMPSANFSGVVGQGGALVYDAGVTPQGRFSGMTATPYLVYTGQSITVNLEVSSSTTINNVVPSAVTVTATGGASATLVSGPLPTSWNVGVGETRTFTWTYTATAGTTPGSLKFSASASSGATTWPVAVSESVLVSPVLTYQTRIFGVPSLPSTIQKITNVAMISDFSTISPGVNSSPVTTNLLWPVFFLSKTISPTVAYPGNTVTFTIPYSNNGTGQATSVTISDQVPSNLTNIVPANGGVYSSPNITWNVGTVAAGASGTVSFTAQVAVDYPAGLYTVANSASITSAQTPTAVAATANFTVDARPQLTVTKQQTSNSPKDASLIVLPDNVITYTIVVTNTGSGQATSVTITDTVPQYTTFSSASDGGVLNSGTVTWSIGTLNAGANATRTLAVTVNNPNINGGIILNNASVSASGLAALSSNYVSYQIEAIAQLSVVKDSNPSDGSKVHVGNTITYTVDITNSGTSSIGSISVTDSMPLNTQYVPNSTTLNGGAVADVGGKSQLESGVNIPTLVGSSSASITFSVNTVAPDYVGTVISNSAVAESPVTGIVESNTVSHTNYGIDVTVSVGLYNTDHVSSAIAMSPQTEYAIKVTVTHPSTLANLSTVKVSIFYDADGVFASQEVPSSANAQTAAILTLTVGGTPNWAIAPNTNTSWSLVQGNSAQPVLTNTTGDFWFHFKPGKVATETTGSAKWHIYAEATAPDGYGESYQDNRTMNWYGEITVNSPSISFGTVELGSDFSANPTTGISVTYICNGNYSQQVKSNSPWTGSGYPVSLNAAGSPGEAEFSLKADDTATLGNALLVSTVYTTIGTGTQTGEDGNTVSTNAMWLKLGALGLPAVTYNGAVYYLIAQ